MNMGVSIVPWGVVMVPRRAPVPASLLSSLNFISPFSGDFSVNLTSVEYLSWMPGKKQPCTPFTGNIRRILIASRYRLSKVALDGSFCHHFLLHFAETAFSMLYTLNNKRKSGLTLISSGFTGRSQLH
jgi:hypothetical protein